MKPDTSCPAAEELRLYVSGMLDDVRMTETESHLEDCETCNTLAARIERDQPDSLALQMKGLGMLSRSLKVPDFETIKEKRPDDEIEMPKSIGVYEITGLLGHGGMGVVLKARHRHLKRDVAVKLIKTSRQLDPHSVSRFHREMEAIGKLDHPNIVRASDAGVDENGRPFLVMELLHGINIEEYVRKNRSMPVKTACEIIRQTATALSEIHHAGLVHRDIKPSNLFMIDAGVVKILDLGLARLYEVDESHDTVGHANESFGNLAESFTASRQAVVGSAFFIAPEQIRQSHAVTAQADIYSLGCTFFYLLAGRPPYEGNLTKILEAHLNGKFPLLRNYRPDIPPTIDRFIRMMTASRLRERIGSSEEAVIVLDKLLAEV